MRSCTIVMDMDGPLSQKREPDTEWTPEDYGTGIPVPGAREAMLLLHQSGYKLIIHTARPGEFREVTEQWLRTNGFVYDQLVMDKPLGDAQI